MDGKGTNVRTGFIADERDQAVVALHQYSEGKTYAPPRPKAPRTYKVPPKRGVYVVGFGPYVKIGITENFSDRVAQLQTPEKLETFALFEEAAAVYEKMLHRRFSEYRLNGEWFRREGTLAEWINGGCK